jgi:hypothetical protein
LVEQRCLHACTGCALQSGIGKWTLRPVFCFGSEVVK